MSLATVGWGMPPGFYVVCAAAALIDIAYVTHMHVSLLLGSPFLSLFLVLYLAVQSLIRVHLFASPCTVAHQAFLSITIAQTHVHWVGDAIQPSYSLSSLFERTWEVPDGSVDTESDCNAGDTEDPGLIPGLGRSSGRRKWQPIPVSLPEKSHGWRSMVGYNPRGCKVRHGWVTKYGEWLRETAGGEENYSTWWCRIFSKVCFIHLV